MLFRTAAWILLCANCLGQTVTTSSVTVATGYVEPRLVADMLVYAEASKPKIQAAALINIDVPEGTKLFDIWADKIPSMDLAELTEYGSGYLLVGEGKYRVTCYFEPKAIRRVEVVIGGAVNPIEPLPIPSPDSDLAIGARTAVLSFVHSMASNFESLAKDKAKYKTVAEASAASNAMDLLSRQQFKQDRGSLMSPRLGNDQLPADADKTFLDISHGFKSIR